MTFIEMLINAVCEYFDRYINLVETSSLSDDEPELNDGEPELNDVSSNEDPERTHAAI